MADTPINIPINVRAAQTGDLERLLRQARELRQLLEHPLPAGQAPPAGWGTQPGAWPGLLGSNRPMPAEASGRWTPIEGGGPYRGYAPSEWARRGMGAIPPPFVPPPPTGGGGDPDLFKEGTASPFWRRIPPGGGRRPVFVPTPEGPELQPLPGWTYQGRGPGARFPEYQPAVDRWRMRDFGAPYPQYQPAVARWRAGDFGAPFPAAPPAVGYGNYQVYRGRHGGPGAPFPVLPPFPSTPLQQAWATLQQPQTPAQQQQARSQAATTAQQMQHAQLISILGQTPTPLQLAHHQLSTFGTPLQIAHGYQQSLGVAQAQQGLQQAQLISLIAQMGPQGPGLLGRMSGAIGAHGPGVVGALGGAAAGLHSAIQRPARAVVGAAAGFGLYSVLTESMELYRQRAQGIIDVGMRLDVNFERVGTTIDTLREKYQVLAHDSIAAQLAMARITGGTAGLEPAVRAGAAYGVAAPHAAVLAGTLSRLTRPGTAPLSTVAALASMTRPGITPMGVEQLWEETAGIAGVGGTTAARVGVEMPSRWMGLITSLGERYNVPGAASNFFGRFAGGVNEAPDPTTQALRIRSLRALSRRQGPLLRIGDEEVDLRTITGQRIAMEQASQSPEILEQYRRTAGEAFGTNPDQLEMGWQRLLGPGLSLGESRRLRREVERRGGFAGMGAGAVGVTGTQEEIETERLRARGAAPEFQVAMTNALKEAGLERLGEPLVNASNQLKQALLDMTDAIRRNEVTMSTLSTAFSGLDNTTRLLVGTGIAMGSGNMLGAALGAAIGLSGIAMGSPQAGFEYPYTDPFASVPARPGPSLVPQRSGR